VHDALARPAATASLEKPLPGLVEGVPASAAIVLDRVEKRFSGTRSAAVRELSLDVPRGEIVVLVGPSGCGKTTTLKMINRLIEPTGGRILVEGAEARAVPLHELRRGIGYVIQQIGLFPHQKIRDNIATVPKLLGWDRKRTATRVGELAELVGLDPDLLDRYPGELSGGQQQRVGVARALAADPPVLLMDEPFGAVDPIVRARLQDELLDLQDRVRKTIVLVTHDIDEAIKLGNRIALLNVGGVLEQYGTPDELLANPANAFVRAFMGSEPGLKRLSLIEVGDVALDDGPVVGRDASAADAAAVMAEHGVDWIGVRHDGHLEGWVWGNQLDATKPIGDLSTQPFRVTVGPHSSLREALDAVVTSRTHVAVVVDGDRYLGMLTLARISTELLGQPGGRAA
jgi:osmoprotectant transport system ATP-binding protein